MKVLHVAETAKGGVGTYLDELIVLQRAMLPAGNVRVIIPAQHRSQLASIPDSEIAMFDRSGRTAGSLLGLRRLIAAQIGEFRPDILHLHSSFAGIVGRASLLPAYRLPIIYQPHGWGFEMWSTGPKRMLFSAVERALAPLSRRIVTVSQAEHAQGLAAGIAATRLTVVLNGIAEDQPLTPRSEWTDRRRKVLFIGRLDRQKGVDTLIAIAARNTATMSVRIIGSEVAGGQAFPDLPANVECLGWLDRNAIAGQLEACDLLAMPSRWEAFGLTAIEAMRSAKPVIAFGVGGLREVIDKSCGVLVHAGDESGFEAALLAVPPADLKEMGKAGRARFKDRFTSRRMARDILTIYHDVLNGLPGSA